MELFRFESVVVYQLNCSRLKVKIEYVLQIQKALKMQGNPYEKIEIQYFT
jgi:hypothetical protein